MHPEKPDHVEAPDDITHPEFAAIWDRIKPYAMTSPERGFALWSAVNYMVDSGLPGVPPIYSPHLAKYL